MIRYAAVSCAAILAEKFAVAAYVPDKSLPVHISWTLKLPEVPRLGTLDNVNCFVAVLFEVLIIKTCVPLEEAPE